MPRLPTAINSRLRQPAAAGAERRGKREQGGREGAGREGRAAGERWLTLVTCRGGLR